MIAADAATGQRATGELTVDLLHGRQLGGTNCHRFAIIVARQLPQTVLLHRRAVRSHANDHRAGQIGTGTAGRLDGDMHIGGGRHRHILMVEHAAAGAGTVQHLHLHGVRVLRVRRGRAQMLRLRLRLLLHIVVLVVVQWAVVVAVQIVGVRFGEAVRDVAGRTDVVEQRIAFVRTGWLANRRRGGVMDALRWSRVVSFDH